MKKFSPMDIVAMKMQEIGKDKFLLGVSNQGDTVEKLIDGVIKTLEEYKESHKDELSKETEFGFRINLELFEKGEDPMDKFK
jgi:hypothetical protein